MGTAGRARASLQFAWPKVATQFLQLWDGQLGLGHHEGRRQSFESLGCFEHYADVIIQPADLLARLPDVPDSDAGIVDLWRFHQSPDRVATKLLMEITAANPVSIGELRDRGFDLDCILWLAKKGLRRILSAPPTPS